MKEKDFIVDVNIDQSEAEQARCWRKPSSFSDYKQDPLVLFLTGFLLITLLALIGARTTLLIIKSGEEINPPRGVAAVPLSEWSDKAHDEFLSPKESE